MNVFLKFFNLFCFTVGMLLAPPCYAIDFLLVEAPGGNPIGQLETGDTIYLQQVGSDLNIVAEVEDNAGQEKVSFVLNGDAVRIERGKPYTLAGDDGNGTYNAWTPDTGTYTLSAIALDAGNNTVDQSTISFTVSNESLPDIALTLVDPDTDTDLYELNNSDTIDLSSNSALNVRADVSVDNVDSVRFTLDGTAFRTERAAPYALAGDDGHGDYYAWTPDAGSHTLTVEADSADGTVVAQRTATFFVTAQDQGKELYVSKNGSDAVGYDENDIDHPWQTVAHAWASVKDGDIVYYREGVYDIDGKIDIISSGEGVTHKAYPGETVTWSSPITGSAVIEIGEPNITIDGINVESAISGEEGGFSGWVGIRMALGQVDLH